MTKINLRIPSPSFFVVRSHSGGGRTASGVFSIPRNKKMKKVLVIKDYEKFVRKMKEKTISLLENFSDNLSNDLSGLFLRELKIKLSEHDVSQMISDSEIKSIISGYTKEIDGNLVIKQKDLERCSDSLRERFASNLVSFLVKNNYVEQGYDEEQNNFCFF